MGTLSMDSDPSNLVPFIYGNKYTNSRKHLGGKPRGNQRKRTVKRHSLGLELGKRRLRDNEGGWDRPELKRQACFHASENSTTAEADEYLPCRQQ